MVPEIEAISTQTLVELEARTGAAGDPDRASRAPDHGSRRHPPAGGETLGLRTSPYRFVDTRGDYRAAVAELGLPCVVKPVMSSSGHGQSLVRDGADIDRRLGLRADRRPRRRGRAIVEGFVDFDYEITLLTVRHAGGTSFCEPIGHLQEDGDYRESWQPQPMSPLALQRSQEIARAICDDLGGWGVFGVELFVKGRRCGSAKSPAPARHRPGHARLAGTVRVRAACARDPGAADPGGPPARPSASCALLAHGHGVPVFGDVGAALAVPDTALRLFGKPRVGAIAASAVTLARGEAWTRRGRSRATAAALRIELHAS